MQKTIDETNYRREKQINYNTSNNITPQALVKKIDNPLAKDEIVSYQYEEHLKKVAEEASAYLTKPQIEKKIRETRKAMEAAAKELDFIKAAQLRDEIKMLQEKL